MYVPRLIPCLLLQNGGLVKTIRFKSPHYLADPINVIRIFNDLEVDELIILDINASNEKRAPDINFLKQITTECFMPLCYGGGIKSIDEMKLLFNVGIEKISINSYAIKNPDIINQAAKIFGSQSIVVSVDVKKTFWGRYKVYAFGGRKKTDIDPVEWCIDMEKRGAGELLVNSMDMDGLMNGYDLNLFSSITSKVRIPVIASGGAGSVQDLLDVIKVAGASAAGAGSLFVYQGKNRSVLINYPRVAELQNWFQE